MKSIPNESSILNIIRNSMQAQWSEALCLAVLNTFDLKRGNSAAFMPK
jgi:hypothetical protein